MYHYLTLASFNFQSLRTAKALSATPTSSSPSSSSTSSSSPSSSSRCPTTSTAPCRAPTRRRRRRERGRNNSRRTRTRCLQGGGGLSGKSSYDFKDNFLDPSHKKIQTVKKPSVSVRPSVCCSRRPYYHYVMLRHSPPEETFFHCRVFEKYSESLVEARRWTALLHRCIAHREKK